MGGVSRQEQLTALHRLDDQAAHRCDAILNDLAGLKVRLSQAAGYLRTADLSIETIAIRTGYGNNASLSKAFKRELGISPGAYRRTRGEAASPAGLIAVDILTETTPDQWPA